MEQRTLQHLPWGILRTLHHGVFMCADNWFHSHPLNLLHWRVLILVMVLHCWRMSSLRGSPSPFWADVSSGDWMICSGIVSPRWSMLDKQWLWSLRGRVCVFMFALGEECVCKVWVKFGVWSIEVRREGQRKLQWKRTLADRWIALIRNP